jgi:DNA-binding protein HU-beta
VAFSLDTLSEPLLACDRLFRGLSKRAKDHELGVEDVKMNKAELIDAVAKNAKLSKKDATNAVNATISTIKKETKKSPVSIVGFGSFQTVKRKPRTGRNPRTGESIQIKASKSVRFRPGKAFKAML